MSTNPSPFEEMTEEDFLELFLEPADFVEATRCVHSLAQVHLALKAAKETKFEAVILSILDRIILEMKPKVSGLDKASLN